MLDSHAIHQLLAEHYTTRIERNTAHMRKRAESRGRALRSGELIDAIRKDYAGHAEIAEETHRVLKAQQCETAEAEKIARQRCRQRWRADYESRSLPAGQLQDIANEIIASADDETRARMQRTAGVEGMTPRKFLTRWFAAEFLAKLDQIRSGEPRYVPDDAA